MDLFENFTSRLFWDLTPIVNFALDNWTITFVTLLLMIRWAGNERRRIKHV